MMKQTSIHRLNADRGLSLPARALYILLNRLNNLYPNARLDPRLELCCFNLPAVDEVLSRYSVLTMSPSRLACDLFLENLPWKALQSELGAIHVVDIGCGSGGVSRILAESSQDGIASYLGLDVAENPRWDTLKQDNPPVRFRHIEGDDLWEEIPEETTFILSCTSMEHIPNDMTYMSRLRDFAADASGAVFQVHLIPSAACLDLYGFHGIRQYTPRTVSHLTRLYPDGTHFRLFRLGGEKSIQLHLDYIADPMNRQNVDRRETETEEYDRLMREVMNVDLSAPTGPAGFYALVIHTKPENDVLCDWACKL